MASPGDRVSAPNPPAAADAAPAAVSETGPPAQWADDMGQTDGAGDYPNGGSMLDEPEFDVEVKLLNQDSPLYSVKRFEDLGLSETILKGVYQMRFSRPSKIQEKALPLLLANPPTNIIGQSQSGTGKTAAFVLNILSRLDLSGTNKTKPQGLVLAPTRELARQIIGVIQVMGAFIENLKVDAAIPVDVSERGRKLEAPVIVGTPGTMMDMIRRRLIDVSGLKVLVLDEADNMLDQQGFGEQCMRVKNALPKQIQICLFSATFDELVLSYAQKFAPQSNILTLATKDLTVEGIKQLYLDCPSENSRYDILVKLYGLMTIGSSVIFVKRRDTAEEIEKRMVAEGHKVASLTSNLVGAQRDEVIDAFRSGQAKVLITTNVLARGIDVQTVSLVVNYDVPDKPKSNEPDYQTYLHRIGRTGRFGRVGVSISFIYDKRSWKMLDDIQKYFGITMTAVPTDDWDVAEEMITKVIKSARADAGFKPEIAT
ncbi:RNA helicase required for poly(A+) mRNA export [Agyrium rufum]|nr:RNA helicase required for poly(A+) mRNA export [Agyrium rufum]